MRTLCSPVASCVKMEKSAPNSSFAWETGTEIASQSPALFRVREVMLFSLSQALTAAVVSAVGARYAAA